MIAYQTGKTVALSSLVPISMSYDDGIAVIWMESKGATVIIEKKGDQHIVKVRVPGKREIRTASTSGFPLRTAFEKWMLVKGPSV